MAGCYNEFGYLSVEIAYFNVVRNRRNYAKLI